MTQFRLIVRFWLLVVLAGGFFPARLRAGASDECSVGVERFGPEAIRDFALKVNDELDARKVNMAIIARAGRLRNQMPRGINYTHVAFAVFEPVRGPHGETFYTYTVYNLYQDSKDGGTRSYLKQDLMYDFVGGVAEPDVAVCIPIEPLQRRLLQVIRSPAYGALHTPDYNLVANPWVDRFDNCVTHTLKICVAAIYDTDDRGRIYEDIRLYFKPTRVRLGLLKSIGSGFVPALRREDADPSGLQTATYDSLKAFLSANGLVSEAFTLSSSAKPRSPAP